MEKRKEILKKRIINLMIRIKRNENMWSRLKVRFINKQLNLVSKDEVRELILVLSGSYLNL